MKLPEYLLSTPRLVLVMLTIASCLFTYSGVLDGEQFMTIIMLVLGYFFGSRGSETTDGKTEREARYDETE